LNGSWPAELEDGGKPEAPASSDVAAQTVRQNAGRLPEKGTVQIIIRSREIGVVEYIEEFRPKLQLHSLGSGDVLDQG